MEEHDEEKWFEERRQEVLAYLLKEGVSHGEVPEYPAWDVVPYTSQYGQLKVRRALILLAGGSYVAIILPTTFLLGI